MNNIFTLLRQINADQPERIRWLNTFEQIYNLLTNADSVADSVSGSFKMRIEAELSGHLLNWTDTSRFERRTSTGTEYSIVTRLNGDEYRTEKDGRQWLTRLNGKPFALLPIRVFDMRGSCSDAHSQAMMRNLK